MGIEATQPNKQTEISGPDQTGRVPSRRTGRMLQDNKLQSFSSQKSYERFDIEKFNPTGLNGVQATYSDYKKM